MTKQKRRELFESNAKKLGLMNLLFQTQEECGELVKAIGKFNRAFGIGQKTEMSSVQATFEMCREFADVKICIEQAMFLMDQSLQTCIQNQYDKALEKVAKRYENEKEKEVTP